jgi:hypothetical protein
LNGGGAANLKSACNTGPSVISPSLLSFISTLKTWTNGMLRNSNKVSIENNRIISKETPFTLNMVKKEKSLEPALNTQESDISDIQGEIVSEESVSEPLHTEPIDSDSDNIHTSLVKDVNETVQEDEIEVGGQTNNIEELKRLVKALQAILEGFSTSKVD